jgi:agmatine deiminase
MAFPTFNYVSEDRAAATQTWSTVANAIAKYEHVVMLVDSASRVDAESSLASEIEIVDVTLDDAWLRDTGPTFVLHPDGALASVEWNFNGWGQQSWARWTHDSAVAAMISSFTGARRIGAELVNEGGGFHVDGAGTLLLTDTVQLDPGRNPDMTKSDVEQRMATLLGIDHCVWLPRGLAADYGAFGTRGHVDLVAAFVGPKRCVAHLETRRNHPDYQTCLTNIGLLRDHGIEVVPIAGPLLGSKQETLVDWSYINFYVGNGFVLVCSFGDPSRDGEAVGTLREQFPGREIEQVDSRYLFSVGGGVHCITLQEPVAGMGNELELRLT